MILTFASNNLESLIAHIKGNDFVMTRESFHQMKAHVSLRRHGQKSVYFKYVIEGNQTIVSFAGRNGWRGKRPIEEKDKNQSHAKLTAGRDNPGRER